jgi:hypothetical protein
LSGSETLLAADPDKDPTPTSRVADLQAVFRIRIHLIRTQIQHFRLNTDPDPRVSMNKMGKNLQLEKNLKIALDQKLQFTYP